MRIPSYFAHFERKNSATFLHVFLYTLRIRCSSFVQTALKYEGIEIYNL
jgi:hypothetical protein